MGDGSGGQHSIGDEDDDDEEDVDDDDRSLRRRPDERRIRNASARSRVLRSFPPNFFFPISSASDLIQSNRFDRLNFKKNFWIDFGFHR